MRNDASLRAGFGFWLTLLAALALSAPAQGEELIGVEGPYLGQKPPKDTAVVFAPGIVSTDASELNAVFSPDGTELIFTRPLKGIRYRMMYMHSIDGKWTRPVEAPFAEGLNAVDPSYSPDGSTVFWCGTTAENVGEDMDIWYSERTGNGWTKAARAEPLINSEAEEVYPILTRSNTFYFISSREGGFGDKDVYSARYAGGRFSDVKNLGESINTEALDSDTFVAPDESFMVISSLRKGGRGSGDLWVSFREKDGGWTNAVNIGPRVNTADMELTPMVSPDGKYLFFTRCGETINGRCDLFWIRTGFLEDLREKKLEP